jgi:predicted ribosome quality control (RQC) complex YloA/Tae2 family protein
MSAELAWTIKDRFTSLDTLALAREVRALGRAHVDKAFDAGPDRWSLTLRAPERGRRELRLAPGRYGALVEGMGPRTDEPGPLARELRRLLSGAVLADVPETGGERSLEIALRRAEDAEPRLLAVEFFGRGNLVVARGGRVAAVAYPRAWAHRTLRVGAEYRPAPRRADPWRAGAQELASVLRASRTDRVTTLAARLGFGGPVAEELLARAELTARESAAESADRAADRVRASMLELLDELGPEPRGYLYRRGEAMLDVEPFRSRRWAGEADVERVEFATFSEAAEAYFARLPSSAESSPTEGGADAERAALERLRERQRSAVARWESEVAARRAQGDAVYAHYAEAERLAGEATDGEPVFETTLGDIRVPLRRGTSPQESARAIYEEMKRAQGKLKGAVVALEETEKRIAALGAGATARPREAAATPGSAVRRRSHWFERYRWFLSSEGVLAIGGRDAESNDRIVRRYLGDRDLYVHADIHGAPSVVVKHPGPGRPDPGDATMREAGQWGLAFSKAWRAGRASGDAFWVAADQVSKAGSAGEFVPRGAWVIHGTKRVLRDLPLELGIGVVGYEGDELWTVAPPSALRARGDLRFLLAPGDERRRGDTEAELARALGLSRARLQPLLPAGGLSIARA